MTAARAGIEILVGITSTGFVLLLNVFIDTLGTASWTYWLLPVGLGLSAWITSALVSEAGEQGVERVIRAIHLQSGKIPWQMIPTKIAVTVLTPCSTGNVEPCVQIGSSLASFMADVFQCDAPERKTLVICG
jgi:H+/Cl- antiporter ClcA